MENELEKQPTKREQLHSKLIELLGSSHVYYQPPESVKIEYTAIVYSFKSVLRRFATNTTFSKLQCYELIVISRLPDPEINDKLLDLQYCSFDRHYKADNLNHYVFTLYY